jgi:hypothetical protein
MNNSNEKHLYEKFMDRSFMRGNEIYLPVNSLTSFIEECNASNIVILGLDFFTVLEDKVIPREIIDASSLFTNAKSRQDALNCNEYVLNCFKQNRSVLKEKHFIAVLDL